LPYSAEGSSRLERPGGRMSDVSQGSGWWQASDLKWYPPELDPSRTSPGRGWWLASDLKWYPSDLEPTHAPAVPEPENGSSPNEPPLASQTLSGLLSTRRQKVFLGAAILLVTGLASGLLAGFTGGGKSPSGPLPAVAGSSGTTTSPSPTLTTPAVTTPPATISPVNPPPVTTAPTTTPSVTTQPVNPTIPTTTIACPSGTVDTSVSTQSRESATGNVWTITLVATLTNNTTGSIVPSYVLVGVLAANGDQLNETNLSPSAESVLGPGQLETLSGSDQVSTASAPHVGPVVAHWTWADSRDAACPF